MIPVRQLRLVSQNFWKNQYAIVIMSHTKAGYPIVRALLDLGMYVVAVSSQLKKNEILRHQLNKQESKRYFTKQVDLNTITSINMLISELKTEVQQVKLFLCLVPRINEEEKCSIFDKYNTALLQTILEVSDLGVGAACAVASRHIIYKDYSHMWVIRFHHQEPDLVHDYFEYVMGLGCTAPKLLNVNLVRKKEPSECGCYLRLENLK